VPLNAKVNHPHKVVFAADIQKIPANTNLKLLQSLCLWDPADKLDVLHIAGAEEDPSLDLEVFESFIHDIPHQTRVIQGKEIAEAIDQYMDDHEADLLVMIKQRKGFFERLLKGSVTKEVSLYAHTPILVLKAL
jgi:nucleotide-binding universal stress UspA family protein